MSDSIGFNLMNFFDYYAFTKEKFNSTGKTDSDSKTKCNQLIQRKKIRRKMFFGYVGKFFWRNCKAFIKVV